MFQYINHSQRLNDLQAYHNTNDLNKAVEMVNYTYIYLIEYLTDMMKSENTQNLLRVFHIFISNENYH